ncbi:amino acid permease [Croceivirga radicis]|uniref:Amino acid permease n=1 Tax=Croceivirga radicis TaxID=1929488 RepID=A0A1V6LQ99_9FLAO|nr:DUF3810 domain-containing protein [Croceivirga radicis]OQD42318.1 amino acid permease [Croceivirga radicis]
MNKTVRLTLAVSIIPQFFLVRLMALNPNWVEKYYSEGIYPYIGSFQRFLFGWLPFSAGDVFYTLIGFAILRYLYLKGKNIWRKPMVFFTELGISLSMVYFLFHFLWGLNYYRLPIHEKLGIEKEYNLEDLVNINTLLIERSNSLQLSLVKDSLQPVHIPYSTKEMFAKTIEGYKKITKTNPFFKYNNPSLKTSLYSLGLTYMGYGGYLNPFTNEAQVNAKLPAIRQPTVSAHEIGHQLGYSSESATNFIGFLVSLQHNDPYFRYAANTHALAYCLSDLKQKDQQAFEKVWDQLNPGIKANYQELSDFWTSYENVTEPVFKALFNSYLKANKQADGIYSYNKVVGLLINYQKVHGI